MAKMVHTERVELDQDGDFVFFFRMVDSRTHKPTGKLHGPSSPIVGVEAVQDSRGAVKEEGQMPLVIRTRTGSVYMTIVPCVVADKLSRVLRKSK
jgi:hypothetical protein